MKTYILATIFFFRRARPRPRCSCRRHRWHDVAGERPPPKHMVTRIDGARLRRAGGPDQSQEWTMTGAADDHPPIAPPDTRPVPSGWVMLAEAFTSVANIVDDPEEAAYELRRALLAGRVHCLRRRFLEAGIEDATLSRPFWRGIKFYAAKDGRGWDILRIRTWLTKGADDSFISKCVLYVWRADINAIWPSAVPDETGLELVGSEPIVTTQVLKHTEAAPIESLKPAEPEAEPSKLVGTTPIIDQAAQSQTAKRAGRPSSKQLMLQRAEERALSTNDGLGRRSTPCLKSVTRFCRSFQIG